MKNRELFHVKRRAPAMIFIAPVSACRSSRRVVTITLGNRMPEHRLSDRGNAVIAGLVKAGKVHITPPGAANVRHGHMRLERVGGGFYWIRCDGSRVLRGRDLAESEQLADGFVQKMAELGAPRQSLMEIPALEPKSSLAAISA